MESRNYSKNKGKKIGKCNICGQEAELTWDHVPPKFCFNTEKVKYNKILDIHNSKPLKESQNGVKFRSICNDCNNRLLGSKYDKEYKKLVDLLYNLYTSKTKLEPYVDIEGLQVNKIARAIVGHFLASKSSFSNNLFEKKLRDYFLDETKLPPKEMSLLYYVYIYNTIIIMRDFIPKKMDNHQYKIPSGFMSCINSFPLAFILVDKPDDKCGLYDLFDYCTNNIDETIKIRIDLLSYLYTDKKTLRDPYWPCSDNDSETGTDMILLSEHSQTDSIFSTKRNFSIK